MTQGTTAGLGAEERLDVRTLAAVLRTDNKGIRMEVRRTVRRPTIIQMTVKSLGQDVQRSKGEMIRF